MASFRAYGMVIDSSLTMPELTHAPNGIPDYHFRLTKSVKEEPADYDWFLRFFQKSGETWLVCGKKDRNFLFRFPGLADFEVGADGKNIVCRPEAETTDDTVRHLLLDNVFPFLLSQRNRLVLHGSGIVIAGGAVVFLGESGRGKSTLSASFCAQRAPLLTDDKVLMEMVDGGFDCVPSYPGLRLWPETASAMLTASVKTSSVAHYTVKQRIAAGHKHLPYAADRVPLSRVYMLDGSNNPQNEILIKKLPPQESFFAISEHAYRLDIKERTLLKDQFHFMSSLVRTFPVYRLTFPRDFSFLPAVRQAILDHLHQA